MFVTRRNKSTGPVGKKGIEPRAASGLNREGLGAERERGKTRASKPIGPSDVSERHAKVRGRS